MKCANKDCLSTAKKNCRVCVDCLADVVEVYAPLNIPLDDAIEEWLRYDEEIEGELSFWSTAPFLLANQGNGASGVGGVVLIALLEIIPMPKLSKKLQAYRDIQAFGRGPGWIANVMLTCGNPTANLIGMLSLLRAGREVHSYSHIMPYEAVMVDGKQTSWKEIRKAGRSIAKGVL